MTVSNINRRLNDLAVAEQEIVAIKSDLQENYVDRTMMNANVDGLRTDITNVEGNVNSVRQDLDELSGRLSGNVDMANVSAIVSTVVTSFIQDHGEDDYTDILNKINDFNDSIDGN